MTDLTPHHFLSTTLERLHRHARPYEDPNVTVARIIDQLEADSSENNALPLIQLDDAAAGSEPQPVREFHYPTEHTNLTFTKIEKATIDGEELVRPKWNSLMSELCQVAIEKHGVTWMIGRKAPRVVHGRSTTGGFHYMKDAKASVQYTDSTKAWDYTSSLALELGVCVEVEFTWRDKPEAAFPGEHGRVTVNRDES